MTIRVDYPEGKTMKSPGGGGTIKVYEGTTQLHIRTRLESKDLKQPFNTELSVKYQACNDRACLAPAVLRVRLDIRQK